MAGCGSKEARELSVYTLNDTVYAMASLGGTQLYFKADNDLPEGTVVYDTAVCQDSVKKVAALYFYSDIQLPMPTRNADIANRINDTVMRIALESNCFTDKSEWPQVYRPGGNPETMMQQLHDGLIPLVFNNLRGLPYVAPTIFSVDGKMPLLSDRLLTYQLDFSQYISHAAHGYYSTIYKVFDLKTGSPLKEGDIFKLTPSNVKAINALLHKSFEALVASDTANRYGPESGWWPDSIAMNGNFGILKESIIYHYNPYEAGCYAAGALDLEILSYELEPYLKKNTAVYKYWHR